MIAKVIIGNSFRAVCFYLCQESKDAEVLATEGVRTDSAQHMAEDFTFQKQLRPSLGKAVLHIALSLRPEDAEGRSPEEVSRLLKAAAQAYRKELAEEIGPLKTQWTLVQHFDKDHPHAHLVLNRVDNHGKVISDTFIGEYSRRACQRVEQQLGLATAEEQGRKQARREGQTNRQAAAVTPREKRIANWQRYRHTVANALVPLADKTGSFAELAAKLAPHDIRQVVSEHRQADGTTRYGVRFELNGHRFKGGEVGQNFTAPRLLEKFAQHQMEVLARQATASAIDEVLGIHEIGKRNPQPAEGERAAQQRVESVAPLPPEVQGNGQPPVPVSTAVLPPTAVAGLEVDLKEAAEPTAGRSPLGRVVLADPPADVAPVEAVVPQQLPAQDAARPAEELRKAAEQQAAEQQATGAALAGVKQEWANIATLAQEAEQADRAGNYTRVAELRYGLIQEAEDRLAAHEEQARATPAGRVLLGDLHAREQERLQVAAEIAAAEQRRQKEQDKIDDAQKTVEAAQREKQRRADVAIAAFQQAQLKVDGYRAQSDEAKEDRDYAFVGILRGIIKGAEGNLQRCEAELRATPGVEAFLALVEAQRKAQQEQAQAAHEQQELANLEHFRGRWPYGGTYVRLQVPVEYLPTVIGAIHARNQVEYEREEHAGTTRPPRVVDGKVAVNVLYDKGENDAKLDDALREFRQNGVEVFEQPADRTKREKRAANTRAFEQQFAEKMSRTKASPKKEMDSPPQMEM